MKNASAATLQRLETPHINGNGISTAKAALYTKGEEIFNAVTHIVGGAFGLAAWMVLLYFTQGDIVSSVAVSTFGICIVILYTMSALYHFLPVGSAKKVFRIFDHCTIFLLIAGTYTPYCLIALGGTDVGTGILIAEWILAVAGIIMNAIAMKNVIIKAVSMVLYVAMGWMILLGLGALLQALSSTAFALLLAGGITYSVGIAFYACGKKVRYLHSVWHIFDIAGTALQFASILLIII